MDGTNLTILHDTNLSAPYDLTLDYDTQTLYWADYNLNKIEKSSTDGSGRAVLTTSNVQDPYSITFFAGRLYWTDSYYRKLYTTPVVTPAVTTITAYQTYYLYGIQAIAEDRQPQGKCLHSCTTIIFITLHNAQVITLAIMSTAVIFVF